MAAALKPIMEGQTAGLTLEARRLPQSSFIAEAAGLVAATIHSEDSTERIVRVKRGFACH